MPVLNEPKILTDKLLKAKRETGHVTHYIDCNSKNFIAAFFEERGIQYTGILHRTQVALQRAKGQLKNHSLRQDSNYPAGRFSFDLPKSFVKRKEDPAGSLGISY